MRPVINTGLHDTNRFTNHCWPDAWQDISPPKGTPHQVTQPKCTHLFLSREEDMSYGEFHLHSPSPYPGSNREPSACEADALTTRPRWLTKLHGGIKMLLGKRFSNFNLHGARNICGAFKFTGVKKISQNNFKVPRAVTLTGARNNT